MGIWLRVMILTAALAASVGAFPLAAVAETIPVGPNESLQEAVASARAGDVLKLGPGVYTGNLVIDKPLRLLGNDAVIHGEGSGDVIRIVADHVELTGLTVENSGQNLEQDDAGIKITGNANTVQGCRLVDVLHGIYLRSAVNNRILDNDITVRQKAQRSEMGNGIHLFKSGGTLLKGNNIEKVRDGIYFQFSADNQIMANRIRLSRYGLHYMYSDRNRFRDNRFDENVGGAAIMFSKGIQLIDNTFSHHIGYKSFGLLLQASYNNRIVGNRFIMNQKGIFMDQSQHNLFADNRIMNNRIGIELWASSQNNTFTGNHLRGNTYTLLSATGAQNNHWDQNGLGNYWEDVPQFDMDYNGIGDLPYQLRQLTDTDIDRNELYAIFIDNPQIAWLQRMMARGRPVTVIDHHPLTQPQVDSLSSRLSPGVLLLVICLAGATAAVWKERDKRWG